MSPRSLAWFGAQLALSMACGSGSLAVSSQPQPSFAAPLRVDSLPPPAQIEYLSSEPPTPGCRWLDGQWLWVSERWDWRPGGWVQPAEDCQYSQPSTTWVVSDGVGALYYKPGRWYSVSQSKVCSDPPPCPGAERPSRSEPARPF